MGNVVGVGRRASWVTRLNSRRWCVTEVAGPVSKQSHVEEVAGKKTFIPFAMVRLCCKTHPTVH